MLILLADENFPITSYKFLLNKGYDIKHISIEDFGIKDYQVIELALQENRLITTFDSDFGELVFRLGYSPILGGNNLIQKNQENICTNSSKANQLTLKDILL